MKKILYLFMFFIISNIISAQTPLKIDAGKDTNYCFGINSGKLNSKIHIGGNPTASGGVAPYKYRWELYSKRTKTKLSLLVDSTKSTLSNFDLSRSTSFMDDIYIFKLTVTDKNLNIVLDSCQIGISLFIDVTTVYEVQFITDSVTLLTSSTFGGILPYTYRWFPTTGVSNPYIANPKVMPKIDTAIQNYEDFHAEITDAIGCTDIDEGTRVFVNPTGIKELSQGKVMIINPVSPLGTMTFTTDLLGSTLQVYSSNGQLQYQTKVENQSIPIGSLINTVGVYFYRLTTFDGKYISGRFVKE